jgi:hypothetical protein
MKNLLLFAVIAACLFLANCSKDTGNDSFTLLTTPTWKTDSLLANGKDAGGPGQLLEKFKGEAKFKTDGTGTFGKFSGKWRFVENKTQIVIESDSLPLPLTNRIIELTEQSFKITTAVPDKNNPLVEVKIRMTFKPK